MNAAAITESRCSIFTTTWTMYVRAFGFHASEITAAQWGVFLPPSIIQWNPFTECFNTSPPKILLRNCSAGDDSGSAATVARVESRGDVLLRYLLGRNLELNCDSLECDFFFFALKVRLCYPLMIHRLQSRYTEHCNRYTEHRAGHAQHRQAAYKWARKEWDHWGINTTTKEVMKGLPAQLC